jgi:hypothetical protein
LTARLSTSRHISLSSVTAHPYSATLSNLSCRCFPRFLVLKATPWVSACPAAVSKLIHVILVASSGRFPAVIPRLCSSDTYHLSIDLSLEPKMFHADSSARSGDLGKPHPHPQAAIPQSSMCNTKLLSISPSALVYPPIPGSSCLPRSMITSG